MPQETECSPLSSSILCGSKGQASKERSIPPTVFLMDPSDHANVSSGIIQLTADISG